MPSTFNDLDGMITGIIKHAMEMEERLWNMKIRGSDSVHPRSGADWIAEAKQLKDKDKGKHGKGKGVKGKDKQGKGKGVKGKGKGDKGYGMENMLWKWRTC